MAYTADNLLTKAGNTTDLQERALILAEAQVLASIEITEKLDQISGQLALVLLEL